MSLRPDGVAGRIAVDTGDASGGALAPPELTGHFEGAPPVMP